LKHRGFLSAETPDVATLVTEAENRLFQAIIADPNHVLRKQFPDIKRSNYNLRPEPMSSRSLWKTIVISFRESCLETYI